MHTLSAAQAQHQAQPQPQLRPVDPADRQAMRHFVQGLSATSRRLRFHGGVKPDSDRLLTHLTQVDGERHIALVAVLACDDGDLIVGEARCVRGAHGAAAEFAIAVAEAWQGSGLAGRLMRALLAAAADAGVDTVVGDVLSYNGRMAGFMRREGFTAGAVDEAGVQRWTRALAAPQCAGSAAPAGWMARLGQRLGLARTLPTA